LSLVLIPKGVVQGSILGLILFSLFINDLIDAIIFSQCHMYADDVQLCERSDLFRTIEKLNADPSSVWNWSVQNGLCLNPEKSQAIIVSKHPLQGLNIPPIMINGNVVPYCEKVKNLGLLINHEFFWKDQVNSIIQKKKIQLFAGSGLALLSMSYDVIFSKVSIGLTNRLRVAWNSCARFIFNIHSREHISEHVQKFSVFL
jgi:Reverse transcriptase (RNA-dependent DNA polymerase)